MASLQRMARVECLCPLVRSRCGSDDLDSGSLLWQVGDRWRDLAAEVKEAQQATIVTLSGAARLVRWEEQGAWHMRVPVEGGNQMGLDGSWGRLDVLDVSPCGVRVSEPDHTWFTSTPVVLVLRGLYPRWVESEPGRRALQLVLARTLPAAPGHPDQRCTTGRCLGVLV